MVCFGEDEPLWIKILTFFGNHVDFNAVLSTEPNNILEPKF